MTSRGRAVRHVIHHTRGRRVVPAIFGRTSTHGTQEALARLTSWCQRTESAGAAALKTFAAHLGVYAWEASTATLSHRTRQLHALRTEGVNAAGTHVVCASAGFHHDRARMEGGGELDRLLAAELLAQQGSDLHG
jgi:hypothetical protein